MIIRRLSDGKEYTESQLGALLKDEKIYGYQGRILFRHWLIYDNEMWQIRAFYGDSPIPYTFPLDPSLYQVRDPQTIPVEEVEFMLNEIRHDLITLGEDSLQMREQAGVFNSIVKTAASRYLHKQET